MLNTACGSYDDEEYPKYVNSRTMEETRSAPGVCERQTDGRPDHGRLINRAGLLDLALSDIALCILLRQYIRVIGEVALQAHHSPALDGSEQPSNVNVIAVDTLGSIFTVVRGSTTCDMLPTGSVNQG